MQPPGYLFTVQIGEPGGFSVPQWGKVMFERKASGVQEGSPLEAKTGQCRRPRCD